MLARRLHDQVFTFQDALVEAALDKERQGIHLLDADIALTGLRRTLLLCHQMGFLSDGQYQHVSVMVAEVGRLLGGWRKGAS